MRFLASVIHAEYDENGILVVGFANDPFDPQTYVTIDMAPEPDEQDFRLRLDGLHIETSVPRLEGYDLVEDIALRDRRVLVRLHAGPAAKAGIDPVIEIDLNNSFEDWDKLEEAIAELNARISQVSRRRVPRWQ
ncbi:Imm10 family immunity protein [Labrys wisconsinensis]|uniref:Uncharacterized protein n=1 Tax=Labrys wisconsinensis TaxID=425677 RepID=A0ABU0J932_9HYPH|nr:Imm10 family immunity protein [Labrys wisconsinensis]MDQ0469769.1 hypothetical protein [Labrys wisconsinensis]